MPIEQMILLAKVNQIEEVSQVALQASQNQDRDHHQSKGQLTPQRLVEQTRAKSQQQDSRL